MLYHWKYTQPPNLPQAILHNLSKPWLWASQQKLHPTCLDCPFSKHTSSPWHLFTLSSAPRTIILMPLLWSMEIMVPSKPTLSYLMKPSLIISGSKDFFPATVFWIFHSYSVSWRGWTESKDSYSPLNTNLWRVDQRAATWTSRDCLVACLLVLRRVLTVQVLTHTCKCCIFLLSAAAGCREVNRAVLLRPRNF